MIRFLKGFIGTGILMLLLLLLGIAYSTLKVGTSLENASLLFTLGLGFFIPISAVLCAAGGLLWMWRTPAGRFSGVLSHSARKQGNDMHSWIYSKVRIGGRDAGAVVVPHQLDRLWQETKNYGQQAEVFKMGRVLVAIRSPQGNRKEWNLKAIRSAYPITSSFMMLACLVGIGFFWFVPIYVLGSMGAKRVLNSEVPLSPGWVGARL